MSIPVRVSGVERVMIIQWGQPTLPTSPSTISFSVPFPTACLVVICNDASTGGAGNGFVIASQDWNATSFSARAYVAGSTAEAVGGAGGINYIAIGY
ncbi:gp53-like domain-containing protein [Escherichia coli]|uniref:gp53-like domain-containing protein n=1 Tax=Escherichia coli TaxID=562 RepID=UPI003B3A9334